jgi:hypothetical protein
MDERQQDTPNPYRRLALTVAASGLAAAAACAPILGQSAQFEKLPPGAWGIVSRDDQMTVLARLPERNTSVRRTSGQRPAARVSNDVLVFSGSATPTSTQAILRQVPVEGIRGGVMPVRFVAAGGRQIAFNPAGAGPRLIPSPADPTVYVFELAGTLRRLTAGGIVSLAVADVVRNFNRPALLAKERPEGHYLLWAADPLWSSDGRYLAYATNREAILAGTTDQSIWLVDDAGRERPLLAGSGESFGAIGWLGNTLLYTDGSGGISSVDVPSGKRRRDIPGFHLAVDRQGISLAYAVGATPEQRKVTVLQRGAPFDVPAPAAGYIYEAYADFSPNGNALLLIARTSEGRTRLTVFSLLTRSIQSVDLPGVPQSSLLINRPAWVQNDAVLVTTAERISGTEQSRLVRVAQHRGR